MGGGGWGVGIEKSGWGVRGWVGGGVLRGRGGLLAKFGARLGTGLDKRGAPLQGILTY